MTQQILQKIREANPELLELSEGCEMRWEQLKATVAGFAPYQGKYLFLNEHGNIVPTELNSEDAVIIGHPPQLNHLLVAIAKTHTDGNVLNYHTNQHRDFVFRPDDRVINYNLHKTVEQNIEDSPELKKFLIGVLIK